MSTSTLPTSGRRLLSGKARVALVAALGSVVGMAFAVSWTALRDVATAIGIPEFAAVLYPFVVDGLMALALVATLVLTDDARRTALRVLGAYTAASLTLNYVHGLVPELHDVATGTTVRLAANDWAHWALVGLAAALPVGAIYFGSDLVARVLHHRPEPTPTGEQQSTAEQPDRQSTTPAPAAPTPVVESAPVDPDPEPVPADESTPTERPRPMRTNTRPKTGPVPAAARSTAPRRTLEELLTEARELPAVDQESAERIRTALRVGAARAREIRDLLALESQPTEEQSTEAPAPAGVDVDQEQPTETTEPVPLHAVPAAEEHPTLLALVDVDDDQLLAVGGAR
ncbi:DUF2637 domain-containing protein [Streptomyces sp. NBC_00104]|uniref:DUF2637 domain-containing protein n=1 Tax=Streptomyces sp. NBC_00104 TaxID=2903621 RepID=UPI002F908FCA